MWLLPLLIVLTTVVLSIPVGFYLAWILDGRYRPPTILAWFERRIDTGAQNWKQYAQALLLFNTLLFLIGFTFLSLQSVAPLNPDGKKMLAPSTIFNTAISFLTNTNLQHYAGEQHLSYFSQMTAILWNMFVSAAVGLAALAAITRGLRGDPRMGNFYLDVWRAVVYVFLPSSLIMGVLLLGSGVPMTFDGTQEVTIVEKDGDGKAQTQKISRGPVAAIIPIKHLGTNGGGFFGANSAHPFENPTALTNFLTCVNFLIFPFSVVICFGRMIKNMRHAAVIYGVMLAFLLFLVFWSVYWDSMHANPGLTGRDGQVHSFDERQSNGTFKQYWLVTTPGQSPERRDRVAGETPPLATPLVGLPVDNDLGNVEGKELRFGTSAGATFAALTTAIACGSVNCSHDSLNPLCGLSPLTGMWLNCIFGGKGVGLVNLLVYLITGVFLSGLMVGRTPEYLGKKVEAREMKLAMLALLIHPILCLGPAGLFAATDWGRKSTSNPGAHGFSELLYEFASASANNGSEFGGLQQTYGFNEVDPASPPAPYSVYWDVATGLVMLLGRFIPIIAPLALAGGLAAKRPTPFTVGTLRTDTFTFAFVLLGTILLVGALLFLPAAVLGPVAEHLGPVPFGG